MHWISLLALLLGLIIFYLLGFWTKQRLVKQGKASEKTSFGTVEGSLLALFAFFLGFTFSISASKIETVRQASVDEANAISTAILRTELYSVTEATEIKKLFEPYLRSRIEYFKVGNPSTSDLITQTNETGQAIWQKAQSIFIEGKQAGASRLMITAINDMLDAVSTRDAAINATLPPSIIWTLYALSFCSCFIVGFGMKRKFLTNFIGVLYILFIALTVSLILDAGDPRGGFINTKKANQQIKQIYAAEFGELSD